jgi:small subunit ribosomal protein S17
MAQARRKTLVGTVIGDKMDKTIIVSIERITRHPMYGKYIRQTSKFYAHDPENKSKLGDRVRIIESRPLSRKKRWLLLEILEQ